MAIVTIMFADDNYGNIMQVLDPEMNHPAGAGIYYHADCKLSPCISPCEG